MKKILVVDDEPDFVEAISEMLTTAGYEVISAADGEEGIKKAQQHKPDLILMDIMMPNLSGDDAVSFLKSDITTNHIPIIFLTALTTNIPKSAEDKGMNVDGQFFKTIGKLFEPKDLLFEIKKLVGG